MKQFKDSNRKLFVTQGHQHFFTNRHLRMNHADVTNLLNVDNVQKRNKNNDR